jgi:predicted CDP-diglyceride synthetase/phosphatidate cytidylyltransferase
MPELWLDIGKSMRVRTSRCFVCVCVCVCNEPTNAQLINSLLYCSSLHCPYISTPLRHLRGCRSQYLLSYVSMWMQYWWYIIRLYTLFSIFTSLEMLQFLVIMKLFCRGIVRKYCVVVVVTKHVTLLDTHPDSVHNGPTLQQHQQTGESIIIIKLKYL